MRQGVPLTIIRCHELLQLISLRSKRGLGELQIRAVLPQLFNLQQCLRQFVGMGLRRFVGSCPVGLQILLDACDIATFSVNFQEDPSALICTALLGVSRCLRNSYQLLALCGQVVDLLRQALPEAFVVRQALFQRSYLIKG